MSRKDYILLAGALKSTKPFAQHSDALAVWTLTVNAIAYQLAGDNSAFNRARFLSACGVES